MDKTKSTTCRMGVSALTLMTASNMMGSGVFMLPSSLAGIGSISVWGWALTFFGVLALALTFSKISMLSPCKGGIVANINHTFGPYIGFQSSLFYWIATWIGNCALLIAGVGYLSVFFPLLHTPLYATITAISILWAFVLLGLQGAKVVGYAQIFTGLCMLAVVLSIGIFGWGGFSPQRYTMIYNVSGQNDIHAIMAAASISLWGFLGVESASVSSDQVSNPTRNVPLATILGLSLAALCYVSSSNVIMGIMPHAELIVSSSPFADTARILWGNQVALLISALAIIACFGAMPGWQILQTEVPKAASDAGLFPRFFAETNRNNVPYKGLLCTALLMTAMLLLTISPNLEKQFHCIILLAVAAGLIPYAFAVISLPIMLSRRPTQNRLIQFKDFLLSFIGLTFVIFALIGTGFKFFILLIAIQILCLIFYRLSLLQKKQNA
ncbi:MULTISPECIES: amino acid permease [Vibrio]|uniref:amino acid permease n=1 Tax=Vibrio TaxID=662 RepID=UPI001929A2E7|nr:MULTISPECIES: amino acid permease [Vibrio]